MLKEEDLRQGQKTLPQPQKHYKTPVLMKNGIIRYCSTVVNNSASNPKKIKNIIKLKLFVNDSEIPSGNNDDDDDQCPFDSFNNNEDDSISNDEDESPVEELAEQHFESEEEKSKRISDEFMDKLKKSLNNEAECNVSVNNQDAFIDLKETYIGQYSVLQICLLILVFINTCNLPIHYYTPLLSLIGCFLPLGSLKKIPSTPSKFFSKFFDIFCNSTAEKFNYAEKGKSSMEIQLYDLQTKMQEKINSRKYRELLYNGKLEIFQKHLNKSYEKVISDINDGLMHLSLFPKFLCYAFNFVFQLFLDGVTPFRGASENLIPAYLVNLQLPLQNRFHLENMIMIGLVSMRGKCDEEIYFKKLVDKLNEKLYSFELKIAGTVFKCSAVVSSIILDTVELTKLFRISSGSTK